MPDQADPTWRERYDHDRQERIIDRLADDIGASRAGANQTPPNAAPPTAAPQKAAPAALHWLDMSNWDNEPVPERQWAIRDRVPLNQVGLFSGEGGTGKSIIELMKNVAHVMAKDWLGSLPEHGPAFYLGAEDDSDELHIRLAVIAKHYGVSFEELIKGGLHVLPLLGEDATLCALNPRTGRVETTALYRQIYEAAGDLKPKNISIDTLSRAFAGNEIDRVQVYAFAMHMQALAKVASGSVTVLSHPSLAGMTSGSGISGSTAWHGAFRFRQYLKGVKAGDGEQPDNDLRELEFKKNQYGPLGETIALRYQNGLFLPVAGGLQPRQARPRNQGGNRVHGPVAAALRSGPQRQPQENLQQLRPHGVRRGARGQKAPAQEERLRGSHAPAVRRRQDHGRGLRQAVAAAVEDHRETTGGRKIRMSAATGFRASRIAARIASRSSRIRGNARHAPIPRGSVTPPRGVTHARRSP